MAQGKKDLSEKEGHLGILGNTESEYGFGLIFSGTLPKLGTVSFMPDSTFLMSVNNEQRMKKTPRPHVTVQSDFNEVLLIMNIMGHCYGRQIGS